MTREMGSPLIAVTTNHRVRPPVVVGVLAAILAACVATGILLPRAGSGAGQVGNVPNLARVPKIDAWRLGLPVVPAARALPNRMIDAWRLGVPAAAAPSSAMVDAWLLGAR